MRKSGFAIWMLMFLSLSCADLEQVDPAERNSFIRFIGDSRQNQAVTMIENDNGEGYLLLANATHGGINYTRVLNIDQKATVLTEFEVEGIRGRDLLSLPDGYLIIGDSIKSISENQQVTRLALIRTDLSGQVTGSYYDGDPEDIRDFEGHSIGLRDNGNYLVLGTEERPNGLHKLVFMEINAGTMAPVWIQTYEIGSRSLHPKLQLQKSSNGQWIWVVTSEIPDGDFVNAYAAVYAAGIDKQAVNYQLLGNDLPGTYKAGHMARGYSGFVMTGTVGNANFQNRNIFFAQIGEGGSIVENSLTIYQDEAEPLRNEDGFAITPTSDGGYLIAGTMASTLTRGNGGLDYFLIKVDGVGTYLWDKNYGGAGDERAVSVLETEDGGFLIYGTSTLQGVSMLNFVKTDKNGELKD